MQYRMLTLLFILYQLFFKKKSEDCQTVTVIGTDIGLLVMMMVAQAQSEVPIFMIQPGTCARQIIYHQCSPVSLLRTHRKSSLQACSYTVLHNSCAIWKENSSQMSHMITCHGILSSTVAVFMDADSNKAGVCCTGEKCVLVLHKWW